VLQVNCSGTSNRRRRVKQVSAAATQVLLHVIGYSFTFTQEEVQGIPQLVLTR